MRSYVSGLFVFALFGLVAAAAQRTCAEDVPVSKLPKAVVDGLKAKFPGAELTSALSETGEDKKLVYEVSLKHKGTNYDIIVTPEGKLTLIEKTIDAKSLPKAISDALDKKYPQAKITLAEELSDGESKVTAYEVHITTADNKEIAIEFDPSGKIVGEE